MCSFARLALESDKRINPDLVSRIDIQPGRMRITLDRPGLACILDIAPDRINDEALRIEVPYRLRRRGVETRIIVGDAPAEIDQTLVRNVVQARRWYADICSGKSYSEIAAHDGTSNRRVQDIVSLAFLSPEVLKQVVAGSQPAGLTTDHLIKTGFSAVWSEQSAAFAELD